MIPILFGVKLIPGSWLPGFLGVVCFACYTRGCTVYSMLYASIYSISCCSSCFRLASSIAFLGSYFVLFFRFSIAFGSCFFFFYCSSWCFTPSSISNFVSWFSLSLTFGGSSALSKLYCPLARIGFSSNGVENSFSTSSSYLGVGFFFKG